MVVSFKNNYRKQIIRLQYLLGNGKSAILTGMEYDPSHTYEIKFQSIYNGGKNDEGVLFGNTVSFFIATNWYANKTVLMSRQNVGVVSIVPEPYNMIIRCKLHGIDVEFFKDDDEVYFHKGQSEKPMVSGKQKMAILGSMNYTYGVNALSKNFNRIYYVKEYDENMILISDLIPVRVGNEGYMLDKITGIMHGNCKDNGNGLPIECIGPDLIEDDRYI